MHVSMLAAVCNSMQSCWGMALLGLKVHEPMEVQTEAMDSAWHCSSSMAGRHASEHVHLCTQAKAAA